MQSVGWCLVILLAGVEPLRAQDTTSTTTGDPLFLTPFIQAGNLTGGRAEAAVQPLAGNVASFAGFLTVNEALGSNMFFWFFPAAERRPEDAPVILWLQGGPGSSSMFGLFVEHGPYEIANGTVRLREYSWSKRYNVLYLDNPVGTGYSFTTPEGLARNQTQVGRDLYAALLQFFKLFPHLQKNEFYVAGQSYAGKYIPALGHTILHNNPAASLKLNLQGLLIGNGLCDPENMYNYGDFLFQIGVLDAHGRDEFKENEDRILDLIRQKRWSDAFEAADMFLYGTMYPYPTLIRNLTGSSYNYHFQYTEEYLSSEWYDFVDQPDIRRKLHVGDSVWHTDYDVLGALREDVLQSVAPWVAELLDHYRVLIYNGHLDIVATYVLSDTFLNRLSWTDADEFRAAPRKLWMVGDELAGYVKTAGNLTQLMVRNAAHVVPADQPRWALDMVNRFVSRAPFSEAGF